MMLGVVAVIKEQPIVDFAVTADPPRDRLVGIASVVAKVSVQIAEAVSEVNERQQKEQHIAPVQQKEHEQVCRERRELNVSPEQIFVGALSEFPANRRRIIAKHAEENITPWVLCFAIVPMFVDGDPIDGFAVVVRSIGVALVMLHVHRVVISL